MLKISMDPHVTTLKIVKLLKISSFFMILYFCNFFLFHTTFWSQFLVYSQQKANFDSLYFSTFSIEKEI